MTLISIPPVSNSIFQYPPNFPNGEVADAWQTWFEEVRANVFTLPTASAGYVLGWDISGNVVNTYVPGVGLTPASVSVAAMDAYSAATTYSTGQYVAYADQSWISIQDNNLNHTPAPGSLYWSLAYSYVAVATLTPGFTTTNQTSRVVFVITVQPSVLDDTTIPLQDTIEVALCTTNTAGKGAICARPGVTASGTLPQTTASQQLADSTVYTVTFNADKTMTLNVAKPTTVNRKVTVTYYTDPIQSLS